MSNKWIHLGKFLVDNDLLKIPYCFIWGGIKKREVRHRTLDILNFELRKDTPANSITKTIIKVPNPCEHYQHNNGTPCLLWEMSMGHENSHLNFEFISLGYQIIYLCCVHKMKCRSKMNFKYKYTYKPLYFPTNSGFPWTPHYERPQIFFT